ncbi:hypothetical protein H6P81_008717 [Aristolochia fimbriata]|uniref:Protein kinase domain-containing protein n=1 Tax=Aristolochia fimbriata TaxID=158543 RepID=A0AAV7EMC8_ARIFI|nr:hypothetical protein H6P81_008717 [Aristolochia fimbriata]
MGKTPIWVFLLSVTLLFYTSVSVQDDVKQSLLDFFDELSGGGVRPADPDFGWNQTSDPCKWFGIDCTKQYDIKRIALEGVGLAGTLDKVGMGIICSIESILVLSVQNNSIGGGIPDVFSDCKHLTHLFFARNKFSGEVPDSISSLNNLKKLDISNNNLSGELPDLNKISGLVMFLAENNNLTGQIPDLDFVNLQQFNVSFNNLSGPVPDLDGRFDASTVMGNSQLCGKPLQNKCPPSPPSKHSKSKNGEKILMYLGYILLAAVFVFFFLFVLLRRRKKNAEEKVTPLENKKMESLKESKTKTTKASTEGSSTDYKTTSKSEYSIHSPNDLSMSMVSQSLVIVTRSSEKGLKFEDLLKAPAELLGRGRYGSLYKVMFGNGSDLAVKRIKDWVISKEEFQTRMEKIDQTKHPNIMAPVAFYCSKEEKLVVYEFQPNGSLYKLLHCGNEANGRSTFDWGSRLSVASTIAEAVAYMHNELNEEGIGHGNLKSSNIMFNSNMEACISEYGLMPMDDTSTSSVHHVAMDQSRVQPTDTFKSDVYKFGVILLELLTGKLVQNNGFDLARWVHSVVREEWTVEVFDKGLIMEGASEERMVNLLQVALKCINPSAAARPPMNQVANMINTIREEEERSIVSEA